MWRTLCVPTHRTAICYAEVPTEALWWQFCILICYPSHLRKNCNGWLCLCFRHSLDNTKQIIMFVRTACDIFLWSDLPWHYCFLEFSTSKVKHMEEHINSPTHLCQNTYKHIKPQELPIEIIPAYHFSHNKCKQYSCCM